MPTAAGRLKLVLTDIEGRPLKENVDVRLQHTTLASATVRARLPAGKSAVITGLHRQPVGTYRIEVDPPSYLPVSRFVVIKSEGTTSLEIPFPVDPSKVKRVEFPKYDELVDDARRVLEASDNVLGFETLSGAVLYEKLDDVRRAGLLNIVAKLARTRFSDDGRTALSFVQHLVELRGDRFFAVVQKTLREEAKNAVHTNQFVAAGSVLHHPPTGFELAGSFKTTDHFANLQLTFFAQGDQWMADIDIDDANGVEHLFQVLRNAISGRPTHPYDIHELLVSYQKLDPGYALMV